MYDEETEAYTGDVEKLTGKIADLTKTAKTPGGISLFTDASKTEYKSTYELLKEISEIYDDLTDKNQAELLEALAGKRNGQIIAATIRNFKTAEEAMDNMANSAGSADAEMSIVEESVDFKLNKMKQTLIGVEQQFIKSDFLGNMAEAGTGLLTVLGKLIGAFDKIASFGGNLSGLGGTLGAISGLFMAKNGVGKIIKSARPLKVA